jgi:UPF0042 nucleotide-binding protein
VLADLRGDADLVIDTTRLNVHQLTDRIAERSAPPSTAAQGHVVSFGFKYGIPVDADFVADMRFLPNPHWVPELRRDGPRRRRAHVRPRPAGARFLEQYLRSSRPSRGGYLREGKRFMTVAIGCTAASTAASDDEEIVRGFAPAARRPPPTATSARSATRRRAARRGVALGGGTGCATLARCGHSSTRSTT